MTNERQRVEGAVDTLTGKLKKGWGRLFGHHDIEARGKAQELEGQARTAAADAQGKVEEIAGSAKEKVDDVTRDRGPQH